MLETIGQTATTSDHDHSEQKREKSAHMSIGAIVDGRISETNEHKSKKTTISSLINLINCGKNVILNKKPTVEVPCEVGSK
jgi:hypothetical protein